MQPSIGQRALSTLASKLHPQLPLSPRESQQLLNLLTTSFRTHLDREHPVHVLEKSQQQTVHKDAPYERYDLPHALSSSALASYHIGAVLSNPLFAMKPPQRGSDITASEVLKDPMGWFVSQIATGNATLSKASLCLDMLDKCTPEQSRRLHNNKTARATISDWLSSSGLDSSDEFLEMCIAKPQSKRPSPTFLARLVSLLIADGRTSLLWKWYTHTWQSEPSLSKTLLFRKLLLKHMVSTEANQDLRRGLIVFMRAYESVKEPTDKSYRQLRPAGQYLVQCIMSRPTGTVDHVLYNSFRHSTQRWINSRWSQAVNSMLSLHHPTNASAMSGLRFIQAPDGAATYSKSEPSRRRFIVQLSLGLARQLLEEEDYEDAQLVMAFAKQHFPDLVLSNLSTEQQPVADRLLKKTKMEERNLELLDGLALT